MYSAGRAFEVANRGYRDQIPATYPAVFKLTGAEQFSDRIPIQA
jgi:hypothetical protein